MPQSIAEVKAAYEAGFVIECKMPMLGRWQHAPMPSWDPSYEYRVAEEQSVAQLQEELAEWRKLRQTTVLHVSLMRGLPARLDANQLKHLLGNQE